MRTDEKNPHDWFLLAKERLKKADALYRQFEPSYSGVELLEEAIERYLKGYLVANGWPLERIHDLNRLVEAAMRSIRNLRTSRNWHIPLQNSFGSNIIQAVT